MFALLIGLVQAHFEHCGVSERVSPRADEVLPVQGGRGGTRERQAEGHDANSAGAVQEAHPQQDRIRHADNLHTKSRKGTIFIIPCFRTCLRICRVRTYLDYVTQPCDVGHMTV